MSLLERRFVAEFLCINHIIMCVWGGIKSLIELIMHERSFAVSGLWFNKNYFVS